MKRTPLRRKTRLRPRSRTKKYRRRERDLDFMGLVRRLPCIVQAWAVLRRLLVLQRAADFDGAARALHLADVYLSTRLPTCCEGHVQADHAGVRGLGQKADDSTCIPLCRKHHRERTDYAETFYDWDGADMRVWCDWAIEKTRADVDSIRKQTVGIFGEP